MSLAAKTSSTLADTVTFKCLIINYIQFFFLNISRADRRALCSSANQMTEKEWLCLKQASQKLTIMLLLHKATLAQLVEKDDDEPDPQ